MAVIVAGDISKNDIVEMSGVMKAMERDIHNIKSIEGLIEKIEHITPKATVRYGKLSIDSCLMIPVDKVIETIKEYCEVSNNADSD